MSLRRPGGRPARGRCGWHRAVSSFPRRRCASCCARAYTWFLTPQGTIGYSYLRRFARREAESEVEAAGLRVVASIGGHVLAEIAPGRGARPGPVQSSAVL